METSKWIKIALTVGNAVILIGSYAIGSYFYKNAQNYKKESQRLKNGGTSTYEDLVQALSNAECDVEVDNLSFSGISEPFKKVAVKSKINDKQYLAIQIVTQESNKTTTQTEWVQKFDLVDNTQHKIEVNVTNRLYYAQSLYKDIKPDDKHSGKISIKDLFSCKVSEKGIAFGSNLYVFGKFIKNKLGQIECKRALVVCDAANASQETSFRAFECYFSAFILGAISLTCIGLSIYYVDYQKKQAQKKYNRQLLS